jgi:hypothetical protein
MPVEPAEPAEPVFAAFAELEPLLAQAVSASAPAASSVVIPIAGRSLARPGPLPEFLVIVLSPQRNDETSRRAGGAWNGLLAPVTQSALDPAEQHREDDRSEGHDDHADEG